MIPRKHVALRRTIPFFLVGLLIFVLYLIFFVGIHEIVLIAQRISLLYYSAAVILLLLDNLFYALTWQFFLRPLSVKVPFTKTFMFIWIGAFTDILIPAESISGDASRAYLMSKESGENAGKVVASIVSHRILSIIITLSSLILSSTTLFILQIHVEAFVLNLIALIMGGTAISLVFIFLLCFKVELTQRIIDLLIRFLEFISRGRLKTYSLRSKTQKAVEAFHKSIQVFRMRPKSLILPILFSIISWFLSVVLSFLVFESIDYRVSFGVLVIVHSIICSIQTAPIGIVAGVGPIDIIMSSLYAILGVPLEVGATATVLIRVLTVWFRLLIGFISLQWVGIKTLMGKST